MGAGDSRPAAVPLEGLVKGDILLLGGTQETDIGALPRGLVQGVIASQRTNSFATQKQRLSSWTSVAIVLQHKQDMYLLRPDTDGLQVQPLQAGLSLLARSGTAIAVRRPVLPPPELARFGAMLDELLVSAARGLRWDAFLPDQGPGSAAPASARSRAHGVTSGPSSATLGLFGGSKAAMSIKQSGAPSSGSGAVSSSNMARKRLASSRMLGTFSKGSPAKGGSPSFRAPPGASSRHLGGASASKHRWNMAQMAVMGSAAMLAPRKPVQSTPLPAPLLRTRAAAGGVPALALAGPGRPGEHPNSARGAVPSDSALGQSPFRTPLTASALAAAAGVPVSVARPLAGFTLSEFERRLLRLVLPRCWSAARELTPPQLVEVRRAFHRADRDRSGAIDASEVRSFLADVRGRAVTEAEGRAFRELVDTDNDGLLSERELVMALQRVPLRDSAVPDGVDLGAIVSAETVASVLEMAGLLAPRKCVGVPARRGSGGGSRGQGKARAGRGRGSAASASDDSDEEDEEGEEDDGRPLAAAGLVVPRRASAKVAPAGGRAAGVEGDRGAGGSGGGWGRKSARVAPHPGDGFEPDAKLASGSMVGASAAAGRAEPSTTRSSRSARIGKMPMVHLGSVVVVDADSAASLHFRPSSFATATAGRKDRVRLRVGKLAPEAPVLVELGGEAGGEQRSAKQSMLGSAVAAAAGALGCAVAHGYDGWYGEAKTEADDEALTSPPADKAAAEASLSKLAEGDPTAEDAFVKRTMDELRSKEGVGMVAGRPARRKRPSKRG